MTRKVWTFFLLSLFVVAMASSAFAAKAQQAQQLDPSAIRSIHEFSPLAGGPQDGDFSGYKGASQGTAMGFAAPEDNFVGYKVGSTWYDYQHNGTMGRQIAQGSDGRIHFTWMHKPDGTAGSGNRSIFYNSAIFSAGAWVFSADTNGTQISSLRGGYTNVSVWGDKGVPAWHEGLTEDSYSTYSGIDFSSGGASFTTSAAPVTFTCSNAQTNADDEPFNYLWPITDVDVGTANDPVVLAVTAESVDAAGDDQSMILFRGTDNPTNYGSCGIFVDTIMTIAPIVRQDPNSDEVAMAWFRPRGAKTPGTPGYDSQLNNDVMVVYSADNGASWGTPTNITDYPIEAPNRPYTDLTGMYTSDGCFHLVWSSYPLDEVAGTYSQLGNLEHWDDCNNCFSLLIATDNFDDQCGGPGRWNTNVSKPNLAECDGKLYCTYTYFKSDSDAGAGGPADCSAGGWANGELYVQVSATDGETWGPPVNLSNTPDNGCAAGACESEHWASTVMYGDSLYIFYVGDTDAGGWAGGGTGFEGTAQEDPMMFYVHECFDMTTFVDLSAAPTRFFYPFHTAPGVGVDTNTILQNSGNATANFTTSIAYTSGSGWLSLDSPSGSVGAGCTNTFDFGFTATGPSPEGLYEATITVNFGSGTQDIDVELYSFDPFCLPEHVRLRTGSCLLSVAQETHAANQVEDAGFAFFADTTNYMFDGGLILSNPNTGSWDFNFFHTLNEEPLPANPWGRLYTTDCAPVIDTITGESPADPTYRFVSGSGVNSDSTIAFDVDWYASGHPDSANFMVLHVALGPGPNYSSPLSNVEVAYAADWDIPSDTSSDNRGFADATEQTVYQQGLYAGSPNSNELRLGGMAYRDHDSSFVQAAGGRVWDNPRFVYVVNGYHVDTLSNRVPNITSWATDIPDSSSSGEDLNSIIRVGTVTIDDAAKSSGPTEFNIVFWATNPNEPSQDQDYADILRKAEAFICEYVSPEASFCEQGSAVCDDCTPSDANGDGIRNITDAVYLIQFIFNSGPFPTPWSKCSGDANGDCIVNITDAVYLIQWIFNSGPDPVTCQGFLDNSCDPGVHFPNP